MPFNSGDNHSDGLNPWEDAAVSNRSFSQSGLSLSKPRNRSVLGGGDMKGQQAHDPLTTGTALFRDPDANEEEDEGWCWLCSESPFLRLLVKRLVQIWLVVDAGLVLAIVGWLFVGGKNSLHHQSAFIRWFLMMLGSVLLVRSILAVASMLVVMETGGQLLAGWCWCDVQQRRQGLVWSAQISLVLALLAALTALAASNGSLLRYFQQHFAEHDVIIALLKHHLHWIWKALLIWAALECVRYFFFQLYRQQLLQQDRIALQQEYLFGNPQHRRNRPWWWQHPSSDIDVNTNSNEPLLWSETQPTLSAPAGGGRGFFALFRRRGREDDDENIRHDLDFVSIHEEWTSRDEEDPHWWAHDDAADAGGANGGRSRSMQPPSWIHAKHGEMNHVDDDITEAATSRASR